MEVFYLYGKAEKLGVDHDKNKAGQGTSKERNDEVEEKITYAK